MLHFWKTLSFLGSEEFYLLIMPALIWCGDAALGLRVGVLFLLSANLNGAAKLFFHAPRPAWLDSKIVTLATENSFGFPSGHAQNAMAVWGLLAAKAKTRVAWLLASALIALIGVSRLALRVHFVGDVIGGWIIGALLLGAFLKLEKPVAYWLKQQRFRSQVAICGVLSLALGVVGYALSVFTIGWLDDDAVHDVEGQFDGYPILTILDNSGAKSAGALFGVLIGACWMLKNGGYVNGGNKIVRYVIGLIGILVFWFGLGKLLPHSEDGPSLVAAYLRYALVGFWISAGAPLVFRRIELRRPIRLNPPRNS